MRSPVCAAFGMAIVLSATRAHARPVEDASAFAAAEGETIVAGDVRLELRRAKTGDFEMLAAPVTRGAFRGFVADTGYVTEAELTKQTGIDWKNPGFAQEDSHPVVVVSHADALAFVSWVSAKTGRTARLPTEAEYELAARSGTTTAWYVGDDETAARTIAWFGSDAGTMPVAQRVPSAWGFFDLSGNVWEWCSDPYEPHRAADAGGPVAYAMRGGSWRSHAKETQSSARHAGRAGEASAEYGFRFVVTAGTPVAAASLGVPPLGSAKPKSSAPDAEVPRSDESSTGSNLAILIAIVSIPVLFFVLRRRPSQKR